MTPTEPAFDDLARELRAARPRASEELRERVLTIARSEPARLPRRFFPSVRLAAVLVPATAVSALAIVLASGVLSLPSGGDGEEAAVGGAPTTATYESAVPEAADQAESAPATGNLGTVTRAATPPTQTLPPSGQRLQEYRADLRVRVADLEELSRATSEAMRTARSLGGYVVSAQLTTPVGEDGDSVLVVRVPIGRVQDAIARFSQLGTLVAQDISLQDLQVQANRQDDQIAALRRTIATLESELRDPNLTAEQRAELERRLGNARRTLTQRRNAREVTEQRGRLARVALTLTTRAEGQELPPPPPGEFEQTLRDALGALEQLVAWILAALIVTSPFLALTALLVALETRRRRRADERLLQRA
jgi:hypothetical protein